MITIDDLRTYHGLVLDRGEDFLSIPPHGKLHSLISCYTITFPQNMSEDYTILPFVSSTLVISVQKEQIFHCLNGVNTRQDNAGKYANKMDLLLLINFRPGGLYPFWPTEQSQLLNQYIGLNDINKELTKKLEENLLKARSVNELKDKLDELLLSWLQEYSNQGNYKNALNPCVTAMMNQIILQKGTLRIKELSEEFCYSEKQIRRLFTTYVGVNPKLFSKIIRMNQAVSLIKNRNIILTDVAIGAGFFDQSHFIHEFEVICGITPVEYQNKMSVFYNEEIRFTI